MDIFRSDKAPFILGLLITIIGWQVSQFVGEITSTRAVTYSLEVDSRSGEFVARIHNVSRVKSLVNVTFSVVCADGDNCLAPLRSDPGTTPVYGEIEPVAPNALARSQGSSATETPAEGSAGEAPAEGSNEATPAEGSNEATPAEGSNEAMPAEGSDDAMPAASANARPRGVLSDESHSPMLIRFTNTVAAGGAYNIVGRAANPGANIEFYFIPNGEHPTDIFIANRRSFLGFVIENYLVILAVSIAFCILAIVYSIFVVQNIGQKMPQAGEIGQDAKPEKE